jgi:glucose/arabinose dehydrogenase
LTHAIDLTPGGKRLFASSKSNAYSWDYDAASAKTTSRAATWVTGMSNADHISRTILISKKVPNMMLISRGSGGNIDTDARNVATAHSNIRAFNISGTAKATPYAGGILVGWGLRNSVGLAEHPVTGGKRTLQNLVA